MSENHLLYDSFGKEEIWEFISRRFTLCFVNCCCKLAAAGKASRRDVLGYFWTSSRARCPRKDNCWNIGNCAGCGPNTTGICQTHYSFKIITMKKSVLLTLSVLFSFFATAQNDFPVRGLAIAAPDKGNVDRFVKFINEELATRKINTLILRVDYNFKYKTHPS